MFTGVCGALLVAALLRIIPNRSDASWVVAILIPWGILVSQFTRGNAALPSTLWLALGLRLVQVGAPPWLSDDLYRYLFEGRALLEGGNPFTHAPAALAHLDPGLAAQVNHAEIPSIYPPVAQVWFRLLALLGREAWVAQLCTALVDVLNVSLLHRLLSQRGQATWPALLYALHPLPVLEAAHGAHLEPLGLSACLGFLLTIDARPKLAAGFMGMGIGIKLLPVLFLPALFRRLGPRRFFPTLAVVGALLLLLLLPVLSAGPALLEALSTYANHWSFNGLLQPLLVPLFGSKTRVVLGLAGLGVVIQAARQADPAWAWWWVGTGFLMLSPTVHPWYVLWAFAPALVLGRRDWAFAAVALQSSYLVLATLDPTTGAWDVPGWLAPLTWTGVGASFLYARRLDSPTIP